MWLSCILMILNELQTERSLCVAEFLMIFSIYIMIRLHTEPRPKETTRSQQEETCYGPLMISNYRSF